MSIAETTLDPSDNMIIKRGRILRYDPTGQGLLSIEGTQYNFSLENNWRSDTVPVTGMEINAVINGSNNLLTVQSIGSGGDTQTSAPSEMMSGLSSALSRMFDSDDNAKSSIAIGYALYLAGGLIYAYLSSSADVGGITGAIFTVPAVVFNYVRREEVRGSWLESHSRFQVRTFWYALILTTLIGAIGGAVLGGAIGGGVSSGVMWTIEQSISVAHFCYFAWFFVRIGMGFLRFKNEQPMYANQSNPS
jgi:uncharacterized membrane protein